ncbi:hypothetical protein [Bordetella bronchialis]|uniref:hypothetical protein n=1 Tax=Bordetella bronchialis TaxID=463025 RepID=UPI000A41DDF7|nr:hypothetical protein [Bordetella bronchialis]
MDGGYKLRIGQRRLIRRIDRAAVITLEAMPNISNRTPTAQGGGGGSRGPRTGKNGMIGTCHENTVHPYSDSWQVPAAVFVGDVPLYRKSGGRCRLFPALWLCRKTRMK